jgi:hypothetical protein
MRASTLSKTVTILAGLATIALPILPALAQADRLPPSGATDGAAGFRDEKGKVWTPDNVGQPDTKPVPPQDRAFDPRRQVVNTPTVSIQVPNVSVIGAVPVLSRPGSSVPIVTLETPSLRLVDGERWVATLILANNGERVIDAQISCRFNNDSLLVEEAKIMLRGIEPGQRVEAPARGPLGSLYVNTAVCAVDSPLQ